MIARALGSQQKGSFVGDAAVGSVHSVTFDLPGVTLQNQPVAVASLNLDPYLGFRADGILGYDFISTFVVEISYADKQFSALKTPGSHNSYPQPGSSV